MRLSPMANENRIQSDRHDTEEELRQASPNAPICSHSESGTSDWDRNMSQTAISAAQAANIIGRAREIRDEVRGNESLPRRSGL